MTLPYVLTCNARSIFNNSEYLNSLAKSKMYASLSAIAVTEGCLTSDIDSTFVTLQAFSSFEQIGHARTTGVVEVPLFSSTSGSAAVFYHFIEP